MDGRLTRRVWGFKQKEMEKGVGRDRASRGRIIVWAWENKQRFWIWIWSIFCDGKLLRKEELSFAVFQERNFFYTTFFVFFRDFLGLKMGLVGMREI